MKEKKIKDERIQQTRSKIFSEGFLITIFLLVISLLVKAYIMKTEYRLYIGDLGILIVSLIYVTIRGMFLGSDLLDNSAKGKKRRSLYTVILSLILTMIGGIKNYFSYKELYTGIFDKHFLAAILVYFISGIILISCVFTALHWFAKREQAQIEKKINETNE